MDQRAVFGGHVGGVDDVLHADRQAEQGALADSPAAKAASAAPGLRQEKAAIELRPGLHLRVDRVDTRQQRLAVLARCQLAAAQEVERRAVALRAASAAGSIDVMRHLYSTAGSHRPMPGNMYSRMIATTWMPM